MLQIITSWHFVHINLCNTLFLPIYFSTGMAYKNAHAIFYEGEQLYSASQWPQWWTSGDWIYWCPWYWCDTSSGWDMQHNNDSTGKKEKQIKPGSYFLRMLSKFDVTSLFELWIFAKVEHSSTAANLLQIICCKFVTSTFTLHLHWQEVWSRL